MSLRNETLENIKESLHMGLIVMVGAGVVCPLLLVFGVMIALQYLG